MIYIEGINMNISFDNVHKFGNILFETQLFKHYHFPDMLNYYSENFVAFKLYLASIKCMKWQPIL